MSQEEKIDASSNIITEQDDLLLQNEFISKLIKPPLN